MYHLHLLLLFHLSAVGKNASSIISHALTNLVSVAIRTKETFSLFGHHDTLRLGLYVSFSLSLIFSVTISV